MEFTPVATQRGTCCFHTGVLPPRSPAVHGRCTGCLPPGLHIMFWCFVAVLCGTLQLSIGAATPCPNGCPQNGTDFKLTLTIPEKTLYSDKAKLIWTMNFDPSPSEIMNYYVITYQAEGSNSKTEMTVDSAFTSETWIRNLEPATPYKVFIKAVFKDADAPIISSDTEEFRTPLQRLDLGLDRKLNLRKGILALVVISGLLFCVVYLFWRQWRITGQLEPTYLPLSYQEPRNIGRVRVVKHLQDSVIHSGSPVHSRQATSCAMTTMSHDQEEAVVMLDESDL